jgi:hypothetical protein
MNLRKIVTSGLFSAAVLGGLSGCDYEIPPEVLESADEKVEEKVVLSEHSEETQKNIGEARANLMFVESALASMRMDRKDPLSKGYDFSELEEAGENDRLLPVNPIITDYDSRNFDVSDFVRDYVHGDLDLERFVDMPYDVANRGLKLGMIETALDLGTSDKKARDSNCFTIIDNQVFDANGADFKNVYWYPGYHGKSWNSIPSMSKGRYREELLPGDMVDIRNKAPYSYHTVFVLKNLGDDNYLIFNQPSYKTGGEIKTKEIPFDKVRVVRPAVPKKK